MVQRMTLNCLFLSEVMLLSAMLRRNSVLIKQNCDKMPANHNQDVFIFNLERGVLANVSILKKTAM